MDSLIDPVNFIKKNMADYSTSSSAPKTNWGTFVYLLEDGTFYSNVSKNLQNIIRTYHNSRVNLPERVNAKIKQGLSVKLYIKSGNKDIHETLTNMDVESRLKMKRGFERTGGYLYVIKHKSGKYFLRRLRTKQDIDQVVHDFIYNLQIRRVKLGKLTNHRLNQFILDNIDDIMRFRNFEGNLVFAYTSYVESIKIRKQYIEDHGPELCLNRHYNKGI